MMLCGMRSPTGRPHPRRRLPPCSRAPGARAHRTTTSAATTRGPAVRCHAASAVDLATSAGPPPVDGDAPGDPITPRDRRANDRPRPWRGHAGGHAGRPGPRAAAPPTGRRSPGPRASRAPLVLGTSDQPGAARPRPRLGRAAVATWLGVAATLLGLAVPVGPGVARLLLTGGALAALLVVNARMDVGHVPTTGPADIRARLERHTARTSRGPTPDHDTTRSEESP